VEGRLAGKTACASAGFDSACTYILPQRDFAIGLRACQLTPAVELFFFNETAATEKEIGKLWDTVRSALEKGLLDPEQIRQTVGAAARSLGEDKKQKGRSFSLDSPKSREARIEVLKQA